MRGFKGVSCLFLLVGSAVLASTPASEIVLPVSPVVPVVPSPMPGVVTKLTKGMRYVAQAPIKCDVELFPEGIVSWVEKKGPRDWTAIFAGGTGDYEDRTFTSAFLYSFGAVTTGKVDVLILPTDPASKVARKRFSLDVDAGTKPIPPPVDPTIPPVVPPIVPPAPVTSFHVIFINERGVTLTQPQKNVMFGAAVENYLNKNTTPENGSVGWRRYDKDIVEVSNETDTFKALWPAVRVKITIVPCVAIQTDSKVDIVPLDATPDAMIATFAKYSGKK